jgi:hypothetical protein
MTRIALVLPLSLGGLSLECGIQKELRNGFGVQNDRSRNARRVKELGRRVLEAV